MPFWGTGFGVENKGPAPASRAVKGALSRSMCVSMTQSKRMRTVLLAIALALPAAAQQPPQQAPPTGLEYVLAGERPRLLVSSRHLRLLRREAERRSPRWVQFEALVKGVAKLPEPGFALALYYLVSEEEAVGRKAVQWALNPEADLRQAALVFDWCQPLLNPKEVELIATRLKRGGERPPPARSVSAMSARVLAAVAVAESDPAHTSRQLRFALQEWWSGQMVPALASRKDAVRMEEWYPLLEFLHTVRLNLLDDLRLNAPVFFKQFPLQFLLSHYPPTLDAAENDFRVPYMPAAGEPDLRVAALVRAAGLSLVSYDSNAVEHQFIQGWLNQDRFQMRGPFGAPYEFFWANPYQPGLSYFNAPLHLHAPTLGQLWVRSSWQEDARWLYWEGTRGQVFENGRIGQLTPAKLGGERRYGEVVLAPPAAGSRYVIDTKDPAIYYLIGLEPDRAYDVEVDDEEVFEQRTDAGGLLALEFPAGRKAGLRLKPSPRPDRSAGRNGNL